MKPAKISIAIVFLCLILSNLNSQAQVTIGSILPPVDGALLELKEYDADASNTTAKKGLVLPRVELSDKVELKPMFPAATTTSQKKEHAGLMVYHIGSADICAGIYVWNGGDWVRYPDDCSVKLICSSTQSNGTYKAGKVLEDENTITMNIQVPTMVDGGTYNIYTNTQNGISFSATGPLEKGSMTITLEGSGTPVREGTRSAFTITAVFSNAKSEPETCSAIVQTENFVTPITYGFGYYGNNAGYKLNDSGTRKLVTTDSNFGTAESSVVKVPTMVPNVNLFTPVSLNIDGLTKTNFVDAINFNTTDILVHGYHSNTSSPDVLNALVTYLQNGGVLIMQDEYHSTTTHITLQILKRLFPAEAASIKIEGYIGGGGSIYRVDAAIDDEITNGPFGNIQGKLWGEDSSDGVAITGIPAEEVIVYSRGPESSPYPNRASMFRLKNYNLFYVSDGGFASNHNSYVGDSYGSTSAYPYAMNANYLPIPRKNWGAGGAYTVYNSQIFANVMYWAIKNARVNK